MNIEYTIVNRDFDALQKKVKIKFLSDSSKKLLENNISENVKYLYIESPYIDKDFRDTYYHDFSKRLKNIDKNSIRIHLFKTKTCIIGTYLGFFTLRDTFPNNIGRSYLSPEAINNTENKFLVLSNFKTSLLGQKYTFKAFPWMQQDINISRCAHISEWEIIRYFSEKYNVYKEQTLYQITDLCDYISRKSPSKGLTIEQISQSLSNYGFSVETRFREREILNQKDNDYDEKLEKLKQGNELFEKMIYIFIESGIPIICGLFKEKHAITLMGHGKLNLDRIKSYNTEKDKIIDSSLLIDEYISCNDHFLPYSSIKRQSSDITIGDIDVIIVPLYEKMYIEVKHLILELLPLIEKQFGLDFEEKQYVRRILLTSSNSFKKFAKDNVRDKLYKTSILTCFMPKFIWVIEYSEPKDFTKQISHRILIDATGLRHSPVNDNILLCKFKDDLIYKTDGNEINYKKINTTKEKCYVNNLEEIK